jgi:hypothetical protein
MILEKFHDVKMAFEKPILFTIKNPSTGLDKVYRVDINSRFLEIKATTQPKPN